MILSGFFRDDHPRLTLSLPGHEGRLWVEFIVDTGFAGDLALPQSLIHRLEAELSGSESFALADGSRLECVVYEMPLDWDDELRSTEILVLEGEPLLGTRLLREMLVQAEISDGGTVQIEPL